MSIKVAFFDAKRYDKEYFERINQDYGLEISYFESRLSVNNVSVTSGFDAICIFVNDNVDAQVAARLREHNVRLIALRCAGYNNIDFKSLDPAIKVVRVPAYSPYAVAEYTVALMLTLNRKIHRAAYRTRDNNFSLDGLLGFDMHSKTVGIIGTGKIGSITAELLRGFGMRVLAHDIYPRHEWASHNAIEYCELDYIYHHADIISLHCPLTAENLHFIDKQALAQMKPHVMIINTGRGKLIDTRDLLNALKRGAVGFAALDVYEEESAYFFEDYSSRLVADDVLERLLTFPNVLITSHQAFFTHEALTNIATTTLQNVYRFFNDDVLENAVKLDEGS